METKKIFLAKTEEFDNVMMFLEEELNKIDVPMKVVMQINLAMEELFVNVAKYAYINKVGEVEINIKYEDNMISISLKDSGIPFNPLAKIDPDISLKAEEREIGGLGIYLVKKTMDNVIYDYKDSYNILTIQKVIK